MLMTATDMLRKYPLETDDEIRDGLSGNICRCTGYQHIVDAVRRPGRKGQAMSPPDDIDLTRLQFVGAKVVRREDPRLPSGAGNYVADIKRHGMLHMAFRRSDHAHAAIRNIDVEAALALPGVVAVYTGGDIAAMANPYQATSRMKNYQATLFAAGGQQGAVCGRGRRCRRGRKPLRRRGCAGADRYRLRPPDRACRPEEALKSGAPKLHDDLESNIPPNANSPGERWTTHLNQPPRRRAAVSISPGPRRLP